MFVVPGKRLLLALALLVPMLPGQVAGDEIALEEMSDGRLWTEAWAREHLDLDYDAAMRAYWKLVRREGVAARTRHRAILRLNDIFVLTGRPRELAELYLLIAKNESLPHSLRDRLASWAKMLDAKGPVLEARFRTAKAQFEARQKANPKPPESDEREQERLWLFRELQDSFQQLEDELLRRLVTPDLGQRPRGAPWQLPGPPADSRWGQRQRELRGRVSELRLQARELEDSGASNTEDYRRIQSQLLLAQEQYEGVIRNMRGTGPYHRQFGELRDLRERITTLEQERKYDAANRLIDRAERTAKSIPPEMLAFVKRFPGVLRDVVYRRETLRHIARRLPYLRQSQTSSERLAVLEDYEKKLAPLVAAGRWEDAARLTLGLIDAHAWLTRLLGTG